LLDFFSLMPGGQGPQHGSLFPGRGGFPLMALKVLLEDGSSSDRIVFPAGRGLQSNCSQRAHCFRGVVGAFGCLIWQSAEGSGAVRHTFTSPFGKVAPSLDERGISFLSRQDPGILGDVKRSRWGWADFPASSRAGFHSTRGHTRTRGTWDRKVHRFPRIQHLLRLGNRRRTIFF